jgi:oligopeptide transport system substrate-binding protein
MLITRLEIKRHDPWAAQFWMLALLFLLSSCTPNHPYPAEEQGRPYLYSDFSEAPKHLDPAISYSSDEYEILEPILEPPFEYHYLKRPYSLIPLTAKNIPEPQYINLQGQLLPKETESSSAHRIVYNIELQKGILYQNHPCFVKTKWPEAVLKNIEQIADFPQQATRELRAEDYVNQIKRLADPRLSSPSPILPIMAKYIAGLEAYAEQLRQKVEAIRQQRRLEQGALYNQELDERAHPIALDLNEFPLEGAVVTGTYSYNIVLQSPYPQILYWLAMPFFAPMPKEAMEFFEQGILSEKGLTLDRCPLGTGPYRIEHYDPNLEIVLTKNENFRKAPYPSEGEPGDLENGLLKDSGQALPFIEKLIFKKEKESLPRWNKFLQGYYDTSGIASDSFEHAIQVSDHGNVEASEVLQSKNIRLRTSAQPSNSYIAFNMLDPVVGGTSEQQRKLRQAIAIAIDMEEFIQIFINGRGVPAQSPLPPGIFGYREGEQGYNPQVYQWDAQLQQATRKSLAEAKKLLAEAGFPGGKDAQGQALKITFVNFWNSASGGPRISWFEKQFQKLGIEMVNETTDYNRFREKMDQGNYQFTMWGWNADYPDPENFLFLLYGPNSRKGYSGENISNYANPRYDELFKKMEAMPSGPERLKVIDEMVDFFYRDLPWVGGYYPVAYGLYHEWYSNSKPHAMLRGGYKFKRIDEKLRESKRQEWNSPLLWPLFAGVGLLALLVFPAYRVVRKRGEARV